jgi:hypothetical protein
VLVGDRQVESALEEVDLESEHRQAIDGLVDGFASEGGDHRGVRDRVRPRPPGRPGEQRDEQDRADDPLEDPAALAVTLHPGDRGGLQPDADLGRLPAFDGDRGDVLDDR